MLWPMGRSASYRMMIPEDWKRIRGSGWFRKFKWERCTGSTRMARPHDFFPELRGNALLSQQGAENCSSPVRRRLWSKPFATARAGKPQAFALPVERSYSYCGSSDP